MKFKDLPTNDGSGSLPFLKMKDGDKVYGVLKGELHEFHQIWNTDKKIVPAGTKGASFRFQVNVIVKEGANYVAKVWEQGATVYRALKDLHESYPLESTVVEIKRSGSTKDDTYYSVLPLPPSKQPGQQAWAVINKIPLNALSVEAAKEPDFDPGPVPPEYDEHAEIPF